VTKPWWQPGYPCKLANLLGTFQSSIKGIDAITPCGISGSMNFDGSAAKGNGTSDPINTSG